MTSSKSMSGKSYKKRRQSNKVLGGLLCVCVAALLVLISVLLFQVDGYMVRGSYHQRDEDVVEFLMQGTLGHNSLYLALTNRGRTMSGNTFIDTITVNMKGPRNIEVVVEEKPLVGYVYFDDHYWYFDRTGMVRVLSKYSQADYNRMIKTGRPLPEENESTPLVSQETSPTAQATPAEAGGDAAAAGDGTVSGPPATPAGDPAAEDGGTEGSSVSGQAGGTTPSGEAAGQAGGTAPSGEAAGQAEGTAPSGDTSGQTNENAEEAGGADVIAPQELAGHFTGALTPPVYFGDYDSSEEETTLYSDESDYTEDSGEGYEDGSEDYAGDSGDYSEDSGSWEEDYEDGSNSYEEASSGEDYDSESDYGGDSEGESSGEDYDSGSDYDEEDSGEDASQDPETITFEDADDVIAPVVITGEETSEGETASEADKPAQTETAARSTAEDMLKSESGAVLTYIPLIEGLSFDRIEVGKTVPGQNSRVFDMLETFQSFVVKTGDVPDRIVVGDKLDLSVFYGGAEVRLGTGDYLDERLGELKYIHPHLAGLTGILHLENFDGTQDEVIFSKK